MRPTLIPSAMSNSQDPMPASEPIANAIIVGIWRNVAASLPSCGKWHPFQQDILGRRGGGGKVVNLFID